MNFRELTKLIEIAEEKQEEYVHVKIYGDGSGGLYEEETELVTWDEEAEIEKNIKGWLKNG